MLLYKYDTVNITLMISLNYLDPEPPRTVTKVKKELFTPEKESPPNDIVKPDIPDTPPEVIRDSIPASLPTVFVMNTAKQVCLSSVKLIRNLWFNHTGCLQDRDRDQDREWVVWFYVEPFTLHLNRDRG